MALTQVYTAIPNDVITAARWNNEFGNIYNNGTDVAFPTTKATSFAGNAVYFDGPQTTSLTSTSAFGLVFAPGAKTGTPGPGAAEGSALNIAAHTFTDSNTAGSGTAAEYSTVSIQRSTLAATNTNVVTTDAATLFIAGAPIQGTNETLTNAYALWIDNGITRLDGDLTVAGTETHSGTVTFSGAVGFTSTITGITIDENPIINGAMDIWQRGTTAVSPASATYICDRWKNAHAFGGAYTVNRSTSVPTVGGTVPLFNYSLEIDVTTADAAVAAGDSVVITNNIEGYNWRHFAQRALTFSFWVYATKTGIHCVSFRNGANDRSYVAEYTVNATNTWEYKSVNISASPSAGTWDYTTGSGLQVDFSLMVGSNLQTTAGAWQTGLYTGTSNAVNDFDSTSNFFRITGVKLELGSVATPFRHRSFETELNLCKRYYQKSFPYATAPAQNAGITDAAFFRAYVAGAVAMGFAMIPMIPAMRAAPTMVGFNPSATNAQVRNTTDNVDDSASAFGSYSNNIAITFTGNAGNAVNETHQAHWTAENEL